MECREEKEGQEEFGEVAGGGTVQIEMWLSGWQGTVENGNDRRLCAGAPFPFRDLWPVNDAAPGRTGKEGEQQRSERGRRKKGGEVLTRL